MTTDAAWAEEMVAKFGDASIRLASLYKIVTKGESPEDGLVVTFRPNLAQRRFLRRLWSRNIILKARQLGFSTLACILWLDTALFSADPIACGIVAQDKDAAEKLFRKVTFAYDNLPAELRQHAALAKRTESEVVFAHNGASIRVATSMRSGTIHRLHVSEFGKIGAKYPMKAKEVITGSIPAVPMESGIVIIESTAEGASGRFYDMSMAAKKLMDTPGHVLNPREYRMHFYPWWQEPGYTLPADAVRLDETDAAYFAKIEGELGRRLAPEQKAWYVATLRADFAGERPLMWQEFPSTINEPFQVSTDGVYFAKQLTMARQQGRIGALPIETGVPVNSFWDLGINDNMAIWLHQRVGLQNRFIGFKKESGEPLSHFSRWLIEWANTHGATFGAHFLPHDAGVKRMGLHPDLNQSVEDMLRELMPGHRFEIVPRVTSVLAGIQATREAFASAWIDEDRCAEGLADLSIYRKQWDDKRGTWKDAPFHGPESDSADAFRQWGQVVAAGGQFAASVAKPVSSGGSRWRARRRGSGMAV